MVAGARGDDSLNRKTTNGGRRGQSERSPTSFRTVLAVGLQSKPGTDIWNLVRRPLVVDWEQAFQILNHVWFAIVERQQFICLRIIHKHWPGLQRQLSTDSIADIRQVTHRRAQVGNLDLVGQVFVVS